MNNLEGEMQIKDRLVPPNFITNPRAELRARMKQPQIEQGYPSQTDRLTMTAEEISQWVEGGMQSIRVQKNSALLMDHPNYVSGLQRGKAIVDNGEQTFPTDTFRPSLLEEGYKTDSRGIPVHPYYDILLEEGAVTGPGFYWNYGPNPSASAVIFVPHEGKLYSAAIKKRGQTLLPGGMVDAKEKAIDAALREAQEETHFDGDLTAQFDLPPRILASGRTTLNAWEESQVGLLIPTALDISEVTLRPGDDAEEAFWTPLNTDTLNTFFVGHANDIRTAIRTYEDAYKKRIAPDGTIHSLAV